MKSPCIFDQASELEELINKTAVEKVLNSRKAVLQPKGFCYNCSEPLVGHAIFCDEFCRDDHEYFEERKKTNVKVK